MQVFARVTIFAGPADLQTPLFTVRLRRYCVKALVDKGVSGLVCASNLRFTKNKSGHQGRFCFATIEEKSIAVRDPQQCQQIAEDVVDAQVDA